MSLILLDEPFSNLDADLRAQMRDEVEKILRATDTTAILVTHDQEEAFVFGDQVGVLHEGRLAQIGAPEVIYHKPAVPDPAGEGAARGSRAAPRHVSRLTGWRIQTFGST